MQPQNLAGLLNRLFYEQRIEKLHPQNIVLLTEDRLNPFCDYYGALVDAEQFLKNKEKCGKISANSQEQYNSAVAFLYANMFSPNLKTPKGRLNDRIRKSLQKDGTLPGSKTLKEFITSLEEGRNSLAKLNKLGFPSSEKKKIEEEFFQHLGKIADYAELLQEYLFKTRPQKNASFNPDDLSRLSLMHLCLINSIKQGNSDYTFLRGECRSRLESFSAEGEEINERQFYHLGKTYHSTGAFVREWNKLIKQISRLEQIRSSPAKRKLELPQLFTRKTAVAASLLALISGGVLAASPYLRYRMKLPTSQIEKVELFYDRGYFQSSLELLTEAKGLLPEQRDYWQGKIRLSQVVEEINKADLYRKIDLAKSLLNSNVPELLEKGMKEEGEKKILKLLFDAGYIKRKDYINFQKDTSTPKQAAQTHLCGLFESNPQDLVEEEKRAFDLARSHDIFYVGDEGEKVQFLINSGKRIVYHLQKKGSGYEVRNISFE